MNKPFDFQRLAYCLLQHKNHQFVSFNSYFKDTPKIHFQVINALYQELLISECHRPDTYNKSTAIAHYNLNPYLLSDFKTWIIKDSTGFPRLHHLLDLYTNEQLFNAFQELTHKGFIKSHIYKKSIYLLYPVLNQFLPLTYAYIKLLYHIKKLYELKNNIIDTIKDTNTLKTELKQKYNNYNKEQLIDILINTDIDKIQKLKKHQIDKNSILFQSIISQLTNYVIPIALQTYLKPLDNTYQPEIDFTDLISNDLKSISDINIGFNQYNNLNQSDIDNPFTDNHVLRKNSINPNAISNTDLKPLELISDTPEDINNIDDIAKQLFMPNKKTKTKKKNIIQNPEFFSNQNSENFSMPESENFSQIQNEKVFLKLPDKLTQIAKEKLSKKSKINKIDINELIS